MLRRGALLSTSILAATLGYGRRAYAGSSGCVLSTGTTYICSGQVTGQVIISLDDADVIAASDLDMTDNADGGLLITGKGHLTFTDDPASAIAWEQDGYGLGVKSTDVLDTGSGVVQGLTITTDGTITGGERGIYAYAYTTYGAEAGEVSITVGGDVTGGTGSGIFARNDGSAPVSITVKDGATVSGASGIEVKSGPPSEKPGGDVTITVAGDVEATIPTEYKTNSGLSVENTHYASASLTVEKGGSISSKDNGVRLTSQFGDVSVTVAAGADVSSEGWWGLHLLSLYGDITVSVGGDVSAGKGGIIASAHYGDISVTVQEGGHISAKGGTTLLAYRYSSGTLSITVDGEVETIDDASSFAIRAGYYEGSVAFTVGKTGHVTSASSSYDAVGLEGGTVSVVVAGELASTGGARALRLDGYAGSSLELRSGYTITGGVAAEGPDTDTLKLGGTETGAEADSFDVSKIDDGIGDAEQFQGFDAFEKVGTGDWTLVGSTEVVDEWAVKAGRLFVDGTMNLTAFDVASGATLGGTGTVGSVTLASGSHVMPGSATAPGTLTVDDDFDFVTGSIFDVVVGKDEASKLSILGEATLGGATVSITSADDEADYTSGKTYTILSAMDGYSGTFSDTVESDFVFLDASLSYVDDDVILTLIRNGIDFGSVAATPNQRSVAGAIETLEGDIAEAITVLSEAEAQEAFQTLSGNTIAVVPSLVAAEVESFGTLLQDRLQAVETAAAGGPSALALAYGETAAGGDPTAAAFAAPSSAGFWLKGTGRFGTLEGDGNGTGADYTMGGVTAGADTWLTPDLLAGLAFDYAAIDADFDRNAGSASVSSYALALYGRYRAGGLTLDGRLGYGVTENETRRRIVVGPDVATAAGDFDGDRVQAGFEAGYDLGRVAGTRLRPLASLGYVRIGEDGFTETGAGIYGLTVDERVTESLKSGLGLELARSFAFGGRAAGFELTARALWSHEFLDDRATLDAAFASDPSVGFAVDGATVSRDSALIGLGATAQASEALTLYARYDARLNPDQTDHAVAAGLRVDW